MNDSWSPRKLEPGLAAQYSMPSDLMTSSMKSAPGRSLAETSAAGVLAAAGAAATVAPTCCAMATELCATMAAAPTVAPLRKPRRASEVFLDFDMETALPA